MNKLKKHSAKEKSIILTLTFIIVMFTLGNIPSAIFAIMTRPEFRSKDWFVVRLHIMYFDSLSIDIVSFFFFQKFNIAANMMEIINASFNFYIYCMCNQEIRSQVWNLLSLNWLRNHNKMYLQKKLRRQFILNMYQNRVNT